MENKKIISREKPAHESMDYDVLKETALKQIQYLVGEKWTDHNVHDPGITTLEVLNFGLSDLAYRTNYSIPNILTEKESKGKLPDDNAFFSAANILPSAPLTIRDYKKLLLNIEGVRNAWIEVLNKKFQSIQSIETPKDVRLNGLYEILLEFEDDTILGDLNTNIISWNLDLDLSKYSMFYEQTLDKEINISLPFDSLKCPIKLSFPNWEELCVVWKEKGKVKFIESKITEFEIKDGEPLNYYRYLVEAVYLFKDYPDTHHHLDILVHIDDDFDYEELINIKGIDVSYPDQCDNEGITKEEFKILKDAVRDSENDPESDPMLPIRESLRASLVQDIFDLLKDEIEKTDQQSVLNLYRNKVRTIFGIVNRVKSTLHANRNLCEDFHRIKSTRIQEIQVRSELVFEIGVNPEEVLAEIYFQIHQFLSPAYSFRELSSIEDEEADMLFEGPLLSNGSVDLEDEMSIENLTVIHTSDISKIITKVSGVVAASAIRLSAYVNKQLVTGVEEDQLILVAPELYKPQLKLDSLELVPEREGVEIERDESRILELLQEKVNEATNERLEVEQENFDLKMPSGEYQAIEDYHSVQHLFPSNYGIGEAGLNPRESDERKAQARQFKAYLLFFEQIMTNHLSQLSNVNKLFSISPDISETYYTQSLIEEADLLRIKELFIEEEELDYDCSDPLRASRRIQALEYLKTLKEEIETKIIFEGRRNRFLDHLMARFSEDLIDYSNVERGIVGEEVSTQLIGDKINLLNKYPVISRDRGVAFNYLAKNELGDPDVWGTENISGFQKRIAALLGIKNVERRGLSGRPERCYSPSGLEYILDPYFEFYQEKDDDGIKESRFRVTDMTGDILLSSSMHYEDREFMRQEVDAILKFGRDEKNYDIKLTNPEGRREKRYYFNLLDNTGEVIAREIKFFEQRRSAEVNILRLIKLFDEIANLRENHYEVERYTGEGFYLIERILLRPKNTLTIGYSEPEGENSIVDPYSFRIKLIFPCKSGRFRDEKFRDFAETVVREELPAHIMPEFYWVEYDYNMVVFESIYKKWLILNGTEEPIEIKALKIHTEELESSVNNLMNAIDALHINKGLDEMMIDLVESRGYEVDPRDEVVDPRNEVDPNRSVVNSRIERTGLSSNLAGSEEMRIPSRSTNARLTGRENSEVTSAESIMDGYQYVGGGSNTTAEESESGNGENDSEVFVVSRFVYENQGIGKMEIEDDFKVKEEEILGIGEMAIERDFKIES